MPNKLHIIIAAYQKANATACLLYSLMAQDNQHWLAYVCHDGLPEADFENLKTVFEPENRIAFYNSEKRFGCYGHVNRKIMLDNIVGSPNDFVLITNCDNYYAPVLIDEIWRNVNSNTGIVYWDFIHSHIGHKIMISKLKLNHIDMGAFAVRLPIAQKVGFIHVDYPAADGLFAEECAAYCARNNYSTVHINSVYFVHN
jgi:hypothetical protein